jgi:hypothetical protein
MLKSFLACVALLGVAGLSELPAQDLTQLCNGKITAMGPAVKAGYLGTVTVSTNTGSVTFMVSSQTKITINGQSANYSQLKVGEYCRSAVQYHVAQWIAVVTEPPVAK